jgi:hypothetical protein
MMKVKSLRVEYVVIDENDVPHTAVYAVEGIEIDLTVEHTRGVHPVPSLQDPEKMTFLDDGTGSFKLHVNTKKPAKYL